MAGQPIDVVRRCFEAWDRGDLAGVLANYSDDVVVDATRLMDGIYRGTVAVRAYYEGIMDIFSFINDDAQVVEASDTVTVRTRVRALGAVSGAAVDGDFVYSFEVRDGLVRRVILYPDLDEARAEGVTL